MRRGAVKWEGGRVSKVLPLQWGVGRGSKELVIRREGEGLQNGRGGQVKFYPCKKGGGRQNKL